MKIISLLVLCFLLISNNLISAYSAPFTFAGTTYNVNVACSSPNVVTMSFPSVTFTPVWMAAGAFTNTNIYAERDGESVWAVGVCNGAITKVRIGWFYNNQPKASLFFEASDAPNCPTPITVYPWTMTWVASSTPSYC